MFGNKLDDLKYYRQLDSKNIYENLVKAPQQFEVNWHASQFLHLQFDPQKIKHVVYCGSGYAGLVGNLIQSISPFLLDIPFETVLGYRLPKYADKNTLVIFASFTGEDFEILSTYQEALSKKCPHLILTSAGKLRQQAIENHSSQILIEDRALSPSTDSSNLFSFFGATLGLLTRLSGVPNQHFQSAGMVKAIEKYLELYSRESSTENNPAKQIAQKHKGKGVIFIGSSHLTGICSAAAYYLQNSSQTYSSFLNFPAESNLINNFFTYPTDLKNQLQYIILDSYHYPKIIKEQLDTAKNKLLARKERVTVVKPDSPELAFQMVEALVFFILFSYYLNIVNQTNPS